jgi:hypothetical protein
VEVKWKGCERKESWHNSTYYPKIFLEEPGKTIETSVRAVYISVFENMTSGI